MPIDTNRLLRGLMGEWEATKQPLTNRAAVLPLGEYEDGSVHMAVPGMLEAPLEAPGRMAQTMIDQNEGRISYEDANKAMAGPAFDMVSAAPFATAAMGGVGAVPKGALAANAVDLDHLGFFSKALRSARDLGQAKGTPEQMLAPLLKQSGVKAEIEATGLAKALEGRPSVTRDEIVKHLEDNRVGLQEKQYRQSPGKFKDVLQIGQRAEAAEARGDMAEAQRLWDETELQLEQQKQATPRWAPYSLDPKNPTYAETVMHLPDNKAAFRTGHWSEPNPISHARTSMQRTPEGKFVFHVDELQSDWGQKLRDGGGARDEANIAELKRRITANPEVNELVAKWGTPQRAKFEVMKTGASDQLIHDLNEGSLLRAELSTAEASTPGHPLVNTTDQWVNTALRRMIRQAAEAKADYIGIPSGDTVSAYGMGGGKSGIDYAYNQMYPKNLRNILQKIDPAAEGAYVEKLHSPVTGKPPERSQGHTLFPLTEEMRRRVMEEGFSLFSNPKGAANR